MEESKARIKKYVLIIDSTIEEDGLLDFTIDSVVDRFLIHTNRMQLDESERLPEVLERVLANAVVGTIKSVKDYSIKVSSASDNGQSVSFSSELASYLASKSDSDIFLGSMSLINKFRLLTVIDEVT